MLHEALLLLLMLGQGCLLMQASRSIRQSYTRLMLLQLLRRLPALLLPALLMTHGCPSCGCGCSNGRCCSLGLSLMHSGRGPIRLLG